MKNKRIIIYFLFIFGAMFPAMSFSADYIGSEKPKDSDFQLVPCDGVKVPCDFNALMTLFNRVVNFILYISIPLAAISFSYAGYLYISAAGNSGKIEEAHKIFWSVLIGFIFVSSAWLIVYTIQKALLSSDFKNSDANFLRDKGGSGNVGGGNSGGYINDDSDNSRWEVDSETNIGDFNGTETNMGDMPS